MHTMQEDLSVENWLFKQFTRMDFLPWQASLLIKWGVDWRKAEELMSRGCQPHHALTILKPL